MEDPVTPKLSIIMPTYNGERFLSEQIDSILAQDDDDFELLITDDGSTDGTQALSDSYATRDRRIRVVPSTGNLGQNNRLVQLLREARAPYVAIADQDDRWAPDRNARLFAAMEGRPMAFGRSELIDGAGELKGRSLLDALKLKPGPGVRLRALVQPMFSAHATIAERGMLTEASLCYPLPFDWLMALEALFSRGLVYVDDAVVFHRIHGGNQVNNIREDAPVVTRSYLHWLLLFRKPTRLRLWLVFDFLGRSVNLDGPTRKLFRDLATRCYTVWLSDWRSLRTDGGLRDLLLTALRPFAGSDKDWEYFSWQAELLTQAKLSPAMRREVWRRMTLERRSAGAAATPGDELFRARGRPDPAAADR